MAKELYRSYTKDIRLVSRDPKPVNDTDQLFKANLLSRDQVFEAVKGSEVVYLTIGIDYSVKAWSEQWPVIIRNVVDACIAERARLVFFDNVYSYGKVEGWMTEETPYNPCSKKGKIRLGVISVMLEEMKKGNLQVLIARAPDFYGPDTPNSFLNVMVFDNFRKGKKAQLFISANKKHSLIYTPDAGKATALLGNTASAFNQVWHLPTDRNVLTAAEFVELAAKAYGAKPGYMVLSKFMVRLAGLFVPVIKESIEMLYQNEFDYLFDSSKLEKAFGVAPTPYQAGIKKTAESYK